MDVGATKREAAEVICHMLTYGGVPIMVDGLKAAEEALQACGEWQE